MRSDLLCFLLGEQPGVFLLTSSVTESLRFGASDYATFTIRQVGYDYDLSGVPEPSSFALLSGFAVLALARRRRK